MTPMSNIVFRYSDPSHRGHVPRKPFQDEIGGTAQSQSIPNKSILPPGSTSSKAFQVLHNNLKTWSVFPWTLRNSYNKFTLLYQYVTNTQASNSRD